MTRALGTIVIYVAFVGAGVAILYPPCRQLATWLGF